MRLIFISHIFGFLLFFYQSVVFAGPVHPVQGTVNPGGPKYCWPRVGEPVSCSSERVTCNPNNTCTIWQNGMQVQGTVGDSVQKGR
jgi:hypothetical protein